MTATGRKKLDELYHSVTERSEFYSMVDLHKPPVLFSPPAEHAIDKVIIHFFLYVIQANKSVVCKNSSSSYVDINLIKGHLINDIEFKEIISLYEYEKNI